MTRFSALSVLLFGLFGLLSITACKKDPAADRDKFIGDYAAEETCNPNLPFNMTVFESNTGENDVIITNFGNFAHNVNATVSGSSIVMSTQSFTINNGSPVVITLSGNGTIEGKTMTIAYTWSSQTSGEVTCIVTCTQG